ncbi:hypothetical protein LCGC14_1761950, partial [marine sediment metagenome]
IQLGRDKAKILVSPPTHVWFSNDFPQFSATGHVLEFYTRLLIGPSDFLQGYTGPGRLSEDEYRKRLKAYGPIRSVHDD